MKSLNILFNKYFLLFVFILFSVQSYFYINHIVNDFKLMNEYRYIDEITILDNKEVKNNEYINNNLLFNPNEEKKFNSSNNIFLRDKKQLGLSFNNMVDDIVLSNYQINSYQHLLSKYNYTFPNILYSKNKDMLYSDYLYNNNNNNELESLYIDNENKIDKFYDSYPYFQADTIDKLKEKMNFIRYNIYEQNMQIFDRYYMHENSFMLSPINEMKLGREYSEIFSQYGFLSVWIVDKIMDIYGGFSINNYEKAKKSIDIIYFLAAVSFIFYFFKNNYLRFGFILFLGIALFGNKYYAFSYAPTVTNSRHMLDLLIIGMLFAYMRYGKNMYLFITIFLSTASILIAKDFGQFIFLAMIGTLIIPLVVNYIKTRTINKFNIVAFILLVVFGLLAFKYYPLMDNPSISYFLNGFYSFPFSKNLLFFIILCVVFIQWLFLLVMYKKLEEQNYLYSYIFLLFYTEFLFTYFVWHGSFNNLIMYSFIFSLPFMILYHIADFKLKQNISLIIVLGLSLVYLKYLKSFTDDKKNYDDVFKTHKLYKWNHERAGGIITTYSFENFQDSIDLIKKYSNSDKTYMISKYDNILGILSKKYSGFPFFELRSSIVTKKEFDDIRTQIDNEAKILFVDKDIERDFKKEMAKMSFFDSNPFWRNESIKQRIPKLEVLKKLFQEVKDGYELVEEGKLVNVYRKKNDK